MASLKAPIFDSVSDSHPSVWYSLVEGLGTPEKIQMCLLYVSIQEHSQLLLNTDSLLNYMRKFEQKGCAK